MATATAAATPKRSIDSRTLECCRRAGLLFSGPKRARSHPFMRLGGRRAGGRGRARCVAAPLVGPAGQESRHLAAARALFVRTSGPATAGRQVASRESPNRVQEGERDHANAAAAAAEFKSLPSISKAPRWELVRGPRRPLGRAQKMRLDASRFIIRICRRRHKVGGAKYVLRGAGHLFTFARPAGQIRPDSARFGHIRPHSARSLQATSAPCSPTINQPAPGRRERPAAGARRAALLRLANRSKMNRAALRPGRVCAFSPPLFAGLLF